MVANKGVKLYISIEPQINELSFKEKSDFLSMVLNKIRYSLVTTNDKEPALNSVPEENLYKFNMVNLMTIILASIIGEQLIPPTLLLKYLLRGIPDEALSSYVHDIELALHEARLH
jgi:hypothetical protein